MYRAAARMQRVSWREEPCLRRISTCINLVVGALATMATSQAATLDSVERLMVDGDVIYAIGVTLGDTYPPETSIRF